jgi:adenine-specific DNA-methyltransferase
MFNFPKSVYATRDALATVVGARSDALILDFFAGSATTMHATFLLNQEDGGTRRCIAVTNNEVDPETAMRLADGRVFPGDPAYEAEGIFEKVAMPRVKAAVTGYRPDGKPVQGKYGWANNRPYREGFDENVSFFRLAYVDPDEVELGRQLEMIMPSLWLGAGAVGEWKPPDGEVGWIVPHGSRFGILVRESRFRSFLDAVRTQPGLTHAWIVTDSVEAFAEMAQQLPPELHVSMLYRDYLRNFRVNAERER